MGKLGEMLRDADAASLVDFIRAVKKARRSELAEAVSLAYGLQLVRNESLRPPPQVTPSQPILPQEERMMA